MNSKWWLVLAASAVLALTAAACGSSGNGGSSGGASGEIAGAGSSAQQAAQEAWVAKFEDQNSGATVTYDAIGSGGGRDQFIAGGKTAFAGSDSPFDTTELPKATARCTKDGGGKLIQIPNYISPIAIIYNLQGVDNLQLSPDTTAKIFKGQITTWDDPAIKADNPGANLPSTKITPVHRSDESGTTANFTDYLHGAAPSVWTDDPDSTWPLQGGEAGAQTSGVVQAVKAGDGAIGYADASQAQDLGVAKVKVGNTYVAPSAQGAANDFDQSQKDPELTKAPNVFAYTVQRTPTDPSAYPVLLVSYLMGCTKYSDTSTTDLVKAYFNYIVSDEGQQVAAQNAGSAPIPPGIKKEDQPAIAAIGS
jgi:phosphate transport system substrate-binding protein